MATRSGCRIAELVLYFFVGIVFSAKDNGYPQGIISSKVGWRIFCPKMLGCAIAGWEFSRRLDGLSGNPRSMSRIFFAVLDVPVKDKWLFPETILGQGLGCAFEGWDIFRSGCFQAGDFNKKTSAPDFAGEPRVCRMPSLGAESNSSFG